MMTSKIKAKCYYVDGRWRYYRTADGETFAVKYGYKNNYWYHGNAVKAVKNEDILKYLTGQELEQYLEKYEFVED